MATKVLQSGDSNYPFFGSPLNFITGLDPLGLQTSSEATYAFLLPGLSNLTNRMRYYGFYCWLLNLYESRTTKASTQHQYRFIRRGEFLISLIMASEKPGTPQITGSDFTKPLVETEGRNFYDIQHGADLENGTTYWKYESGAFGQYYLGSLISIGLVKPWYDETEESYIYKTTRTKDGLPVCGDDLAKSFDDGIPVGVTNIFQQSVVDGKVYKTDLPLLYQHFYLDRIEENRYEWGLYKNLLTSRDYPLEDNEDRFSYHRKNSMRDLLEFCWTQNGGRWNWRDYLDYIYQLRPYGLDGLEETRTGWYFYQLNEYWHLSAGTIFWSLLVQLSDSETDVSLPKFLEEFSKLSVNQFVRVTDLGVDTTLATVLEHLPVENEQTLWSNIIDCIKDDDHETALGYGWCLLLTILLKNKERIQTLHEFAESRKIIRDGAVSTNLLWILEQGPKPFESFIQDFLLKKIIHRHTFVALRKMGNGYTATFKFVLEENRLRFVDVFDPRPTSPRLFAVRNLLHDLQIIDHDDNITEAVTTF
jgi:hypothetical protein